jgi:hypothetical protein
MRSTFSTLAFLASALLVKDVAAGVMKRVVVTDEVFVSEEITVTKQADGQLVTGEPVYLTTITQHGQAMVVSSTQGAASAAAPVPVSTAAAAPPASSLAAAPVVQAPASSQAAEAAKKPAPTTLETVKSSTAPASSSSAAASPVSSSPATPASGGKRGIAYTNVADCSALASSGKMSWAYNWGVTDSGLPSGLEFVPALSKNDPAFIGPYVKAANEGIASGSVKYIKSFNEPDNAGQANMFDAVAAAAAHSAVMKQITGSVKIGTPSVSNGLNSAKTMGLDWMKTFLGACSGCQLDFIDIHWYQTPSAVPTLDGAVQDFKDHVTQAAALAPGKPIWVTEFAYLGGDEAAFIKAVLPFLEDSNSPVQRYSYFMAGNGHLGSGSGLSDSGKAYVA